MSHRHPNPKVSHDPESVADRARARQEARASIAQAKAEGHNIIEEGRVARELDANMRARHGRRGQSSPSDGNSDDRWASGNDLKVHPPVHIGGRTYHFSSNWKTIGFGGGDQHTKATGTYAAFRELGRDEPALIRYPNGSGNSSSHWRGSFWLRSNSTVESPRYQILALPSSGGQRAGGWAAAQRVRSLDLADQPEAKGWGVANVRPAWPRQARKHRPDHPGAATARLTRHHHGEGQGIAPMVRARRKVPSGAAGN
jgi:hypothetical protein